MSLQDKYLKVVSAAQSAEINDLKVLEQDGILYISGNTSTSVAKNKVWDAYGEIDTSYSASDINIDIEITGLAKGTPLTVDTENSNLNIRQEPSIEGVILGKAAKGEVVTLVEQSSSDWWKIKTQDGEEGYAYSRYLKA